MQNRRILIFRATSVSSEVVELVHEYQNAINVVVRDSKSDLEQYVRIPNSIWIAWLDELPVGCVIVREMPESFGSGECKRLYVRPSGRGLGIANQLMDALEDWARSIGWKYVYLDTYDGLAAAISLYEARGYERCERYNTNPQATVFMRKLISQGTDSHSRPDSV